MRLSLALVLLLFGCGGPTDPDAGMDAGPRDYEPAPFAPTEATRAYCPGDDDAIEARITDLLRRLTPEEKIALMAGGGLGIVERSWLVPGNEAYGIPGFHMLDGPRGLSRFANVNGTAFPVAMMRGATWDPALEERVGAAMAREIRTVGGDVILAPTINILRHPRWGRAQETYGEDVHHMGEFGVAFIRGAQSEGVLASAKHYAANSIENTRHVVDVEIDERTLREIYLPHFRRAVQDGQVGSVMSAYNQVNGLYCDLNSHLLRDILKGEWAFAGFVESDWITGTHGDATSVQAGLDIEMPANFEFRNLGRALAAEEITEPEIDEAVRRILRAQFCFGLDARERVLDDPSGRETPEHLALARESAARGIVLLRNEASALPLSPGATLAVLGRIATVENIGDAGSSQVMATDVVTALEGLEARSTGTVRHIAGTTLTAGDEATVSAADAVIVVTGLTIDDEGEAELGAGDRTTLSLRDEEITLIETVSALNPNVIVVLEGGSAILVEGWVDGVAAVLHAFYPGSEGGLAIADILFGNLNPSGRLPFSVPVSEADLPAFENVATTVTYGYFHGYRHLDNEATIPRYPFGFGLSYTTFSYSALSVPPTLAADGTLSVSVDVTNTGSIAGRETVQLYIAAVGSRVTRAPRDLRAFAQVELAAGATQTVTLTAPARDIAFYDVGAMAWEVEAIDYEVQVGPSAGDLPLSATFRVE